MAFSSDGDLLVRRPALLELLSGGADAIRALAEEDLLQDLDRRWFQDAARDRGIDPRAYPLRSAGLNPGQLKRLSVLKTLAYAHERLMKHGSPEPDGFERQRDGYERAYGEALEELLRAGVEYDWDGSGVADRTEKSKPAPRRLRRG